jgi:hypothetical protein
MGTVIFSVRERAPTFFWGVPRGPPLSAGRKKAAGIPRVENAKRFSFGASDFHIAGSGAATSVFAAKVTIKAGRTEC